MRRLARLAAAATVVGTLLITATWTVLAIAAAEPTSSCVPTGSGGPPFYFCTVYESLAGAHSELSDIVPIPPTAAPPVPSAMDVALFENPQLPPTDQTNWSDVIVFTPPNGNPNAPSGTVQFLSSGCASPAPTETDISCFPAAATQPPIEEIQVGTGYDSQDCTPFQAIEPQSGIVYAVGHACSDAALNEPGANIPEVPMSFMLPITAVGIFAFVGLRKRKSLSPSPA